MKEQFAHFADVGPTSVADACLHELFEAQVDRSPDAPALISGHTTLSYRELDVLSTRLARHLRARGAGPGRILGIYCERSYRPIVAILACLKSGAAYVPIDPVYPRDRIEYIVGEAGIELIVTEGALREKIAGMFSGAFVSFDEELAVFSALSGERLSCAETGLKPSDLAYLIYTSGTTGRPKGVMAEHRNAYLYTLAMNTVCGTGPEDRVYQGFSLGFDGSIEELWMAFSNGSALVCPERDSPRFGNDLGAYLNKMGITYFSTVPTMISTITDGIASLKTLVVSGEICPEELVTRWARPGLAMWNVYGPTEATVNTTAKLCLPGRPVTIGKNLPGYEIHVLDERMNEVARGEKGQLYVGGRTLARGYLNQPEKTAEVFLTQPDGSRLYKTGDLVRWNEDGELEFFGRIDSQVKIRGFRVELGEIESVLLEDPNILSAAVKLIEKNGVQSLAAFVLLRDPSLGLDRGEVLSALEARLPPYMVPGFLDVLPEFPLLASGKTNRNLLPAPSNPLVRERTAYVAPATDAERAVAAAWAEVFKLEQVSTDADFFRDLGGHSLTAAQVVTKLRQGRYRAVHVRDLYKYPTVKGLAAQLETAPAAITPAVPSRQPEAPFSRTSYYICGAAQFLATYLLYGLYAIPLAWVFVPGQKWFLGEAPFLAFFKPFLVLLFATWPAYLAIAVAAKWILVGRYRAGRYPLWGSFFFRSWLVTRFTAMSGAGLLVGTPLLPLFYRLMGARVGRGCTLDTAMVTAWDLVSIGDESSIGADTQLLGARIEGNEMRVGAVDIGAACFVGIHSAFGLNSRMRDSSRLDDQSLLADGQTLAEGEAVRGSPAVAANVEVPTAPGQAWTRGRAFRYGLAHLALIEASMPLIIAPMLGVLAATKWVFHSRGTAFGFAFLAAMVPAMFVFFCFYYVVLKKLVLARAEPGTYSVYSTFYLRKWFADGLIKSTKSTLLPLYTTIYFPAWLRLLGAKVGRRAEISTLWYFAPDLIDIGEESFFADGSIIGGKRYHRGRMQIGMNKIGRRSFVGNSAILPVGYGLGNESLLGVQSIPPLDTKLTPDGTDWLGSPAFRLPNRQKAGCFSSEEIFEPTRKLILQRCAIDFLRILIPGFLGLGAAVAGFVLMHVAFLSFGMRGLLALSPAIALGMGVAVSLAVIALKWAVMGKFAPVVKPLWCPYVWANEMVNGAYESSMVPAIAPFLGTPFLCMFLRALGCRVGRFTYLGTSLFSEFDLVEIADRAVLNAGAVIQNHLFEDRVFKSSHLKIGRRCTVGNMAVVLYDSEMKTGATLGPLSLLMKGETLAASTRSYGIPNVPEALPPPAARGTLPAAAKAEKKEAALVPSAV